MNATGDAYLPKTLLVVGLFCNLVLYTVFLHREFARNLF